jgi:hypothetical protein
MAFDELIGRQLGILGGWVTLARTRWTNAANRARTSAYGPADLFEDLRSQFVDNWDSWNEMMELPTEEMIPTAVLRGKWNKLTKTSGEARVKYRLTGASYVKPTLFLTPPAPGAFSFAPADYDVKDTGDFEGKIFFKVKVDLPAAPAAPEVYRGMLLVTLGGETLPLAYLIVVAEP